MTPRALLTTIGATAVTFAVAIGVVAGSADGAKTSEAVAASAVDDRMRAYVWHAGKSTDGERRTSWNDPCLIGV